MMKLRFRVFVAVAAVAASLLEPGQVRGEIAGSVETLEAQLEEVLLDSLGNRADAEDWDALRTANSGFVSTLTSRVAQEYWQRASETLSTNDNNTAIGLRSGVGGGLPAALQHTIALEMLEALRVGDVSASQQWRALIALPKHASSVEGALALQRLGANRAQQDAVLQLLAREYITWQSTRVREKLDGLKRVVQAGLANPALADARMTEIDVLARFPREIQAAAGIEQPPLRSSQPISELTRTARAGDWAAFLERFARFRQDWEATLPSLLTPAEVERQGRLLVKLVRLVPKEYHNGVRDGQIVVPLEYREAKNFIVQAQQLVSELSGAWRQTNAVAFEKNAPPLMAKLEETERLIVAKADPAEVETRIRQTEQVLASGFGLTAQRPGADKAAMNEIALEVRTALKNSLAAAQAGRWNEAESQRLEAYTTFDTELEKRVLPRDPELGLRAERSFLDGEEDLPGIKAFLDQRKRGPSLEAAFTRTLQAVDDCVALLKVNLSPATVIYTVLTISAREGLEAVVVLAALLAGMRGVENRTTRKRVVTGAWLALGATALTFWLSRTLIQSLSRFGEKLESIVSVLAVVVLLMVTNWVFHKVYWVGWNAKLRKLSKAAGPAEESGLEWLSLVTVGFLTIYREGFETTLFLQSLILEAGMKWVLVGIALGAIMVGATGLIIFVIGARLPYRKLLVFTGVLVVSILVTFLGSTVRLFQTVGWLPIHPLPALHVPTWMGFWLGIYPSIEGLAIPLLGFAYVGGAWLFVKWQAMRRGAHAMREARETESFAAHPALAKRPPLS